MHNAPVLLHHGGRLREAARRYQVPIGDWLDLSTGINPYAWPVPRIPDEVWRRLPEDDDELENAAREFYRCAELLPVAGSQAAIQGLPLMRASCTVGVVSPTYQEHAHAWRSAGHRVYEISADDIARKLPDLDVLLLVNPNNPTGARYAPQTLLQWHSALSKRGGWLVVDEAFMDATPQDSIASFCARNGLIVLRSLGKFFGMAGARVGFVCAQRDLLLRLHAQLGPWALAAPSRWAATMALRDSAWQEQTRDKLDKISNRLNTLLTVCGLPPTGGCALFQWCETPNANLLHDALARVGILTRLFDTPSSLRFGLPDNEPAWHRLEKALHSQTREHA